LPFRKAANEESRKAGFELLACCDESGGAAKRKSVELEFEWSCQIAAEAEPTQTAVCNKFTSSSDSDEEARRVA
jgi:hypothetical protein